MTINKVFIIAFRENVHVKKSLFQARLKAFGLPKHTPVEIVEVPEKEQVSDSLSRSRLQLHENGSMVSTMSWKEIAFAIGHWRVWQKGREEKHQSILVLEEGFLPETKAYRRLNPEGTWDLLYLWRRSEHGDGSENGDTLFSAGDWMNPGYRTDSFAYGLTGSGIRKVLKSGFDKHLVPAGEFLSAMRGVQPNEEVASLFPNTIEAMAHRIILLSVRICGPSPWKGPGDWRKDTSPYTRPCSMCWVNVRPGGQKNTLTLNSLTKSFR